MGKALARQLYGPVGRRDTSSIFVTPELEQILGSAAEEKESRNPSSSQLKNDYSSEELENLIARQDLPLQKDINNLIRLTANVLEAHSVSLIAPLSTVETLYAGKAKDGSSDTLALLCSHTLSPDAAVPPGRTFVGGPLTWVTKTKKSLQITPFERDAKTLGTYQRSIPLKSVAAVPMKFVYKNRSSFGILAADSLKAYKFTPLQMKLLNELSTNLSRLIELNLEVERRVESTSEVNAELTSTQLNGISTKLEHFISLAKMRSSTYGNKSLALISVTKDLGSILDCPDDKPISAKDSLELCDELSIIWKLISQWIAVRCQDTSTSFSPGAFAPGNGSIYLLCDHLQATSLAHGLKAVVELVFRRKIKPRLRDEGEELLKSVLDAVRIEQYSYSDWISASDSFVRGLYRYL